MQSTASPREGRATTSSARPGRGKEKAVAVTTGGRPWPETLLLLQGLPETPLFPRAAAAAASTPVQEESGTGEGQLAAFTPGLGGGLGLPDRLPESPTGSARLGTPGNASPRARSRSTAAPLLGSGWKPAENHSKPAKKPQPRAPARASRAVRQPRPRKRRLPARTGKRRVAAIRVP